VTLTTELMPELADYAECIQQNPKFGVVGFGKMGMLHSGILNLLKPECVIAVVDRSYLRGRPAPGAGHTY